MTKTKKNGPRNGERFIEKARSKNGAKNGKLIYLMVFAKEKVGAKTTQNTIRSKSIGLKSGMIVIKKTTEFMKKDMNFTDIEY